MEAISSSEMSVETQRTTLISEKIIRFITTAVKTSNPTKDLLGYGFINGKGIDDDDDDIIHSS
jgi:hypothetical protein